MSLDGTAFSYAAGQAALLGRPGASSRVPYSIASSPEETAAHGYLEFLLKLKSDSWGTHLASLRRGSRLAVEGPVGTFAFPGSPVERQFLFVAGGTGIAPLRSMIRHAFQAGVSGRLHLLYSARTAADFAYLPEMTRYAGEGSLELALNATREIPKRWKGGRGRIPREQLASLVEDPATLCFVCGPATMVDEVPRMLMEIGIEPARIRVEEW